MFFGRFDFLLLIENRLMAGTQTIYTSVNFGRPQNPISDGDKC